MKGRNSNSAKRNRHVNIIFFVDSAKTRTIKLPIWVCYSVLLFSVFFLIWGGASVVVLSSLHTEKQRIDRLLTKALSSVYDYQNRYENIFENAYTSSKPKHNMKPVKSIPQIAKMPVTVEKPEKPAVKEVLLAVQSPRIKKTGGTYSIEFELHNLKSTKSEGYVWAVAKVVSGTNEKILLAPKRIRESASFTFKNGESFSIRRFKSITFSFESDMNVSYIKRLSVFVHEPTMSQTTEFGIIVPKRVEAFESSRLQTSPPVTSSGPVIKAHSFQ